jgi:protein-tyrosine kinase
MSIIEQATRRLQELERAGVDVPWGAAGAPREPSLNLLRATAPNDPASAANAAVGAVAATQAAEAASLAPTRRRSDPTRQSKEVALDMARLVTDGYLVPGTSRTGLADEFRVIKRPLLAHAKPGSAQWSTKSNLIMLTSALPGEGKTFCAINLALSLATEVDSSVLLVDADVLRPAVLSRLGVEGEHLGLLDLLIDPELDVAEVMIKTSIPKLSLIPAGAPRIDSTELLASASMDRLLVDLSDRYPERIIIFDAPPLLVTTEAKVLASRMGQIVVVVDENRAHQHEVTKAFGQLKDNPVVLAILNKSHHRAETARYGYYSGADRQGSPKARS